MINLKFPNTTSPDSYLQYQWFFSLLLMIGMMLILSSCGGNTKNTFTAQNGSAIQSSTTPTENYQNRSDAPQAQSRDIQAFMQHFWNNTAADNRCGQCHNTTHDIPFARTDDINLAYSATVPLIDRVNPRASALISKVEAGHHCWEVKASACADVMAQWVKNWMGNSTQDGQQSTAIVFKKPPIIPLVATKVLPNTAPAEFTPLHNTLTQYCGACHAETSPNPQQPYFASSSVQNSWESVLTKIDTKDENRSLSLAQSRLIARLRSESHNCWGDCTANANELKNHIDAIAAGITAQTVNPNLKVSKGMNIDSSTSASSAGRYEEYQIALWSFASGSGGTAYDTSGVEPAMNLSLSGEIRWIGGGGIEIARSGIINSRAWANADSSKKLYNEIGLSGQYSIELWVEPANITQENGHIASYANNAERFNFAATQSLYRYEFSQKTSNDQQANNRVTTDPNAEIVQVSLQHVVITYDRDNRRKIYINGALSDTTDNVTPGLLNNWDKNYIFSLGNAPSGDSQWQGRIRMAAIHSRALSATKVTQNYDVGVGQKFYLLFDVSEHLSINDCRNSYIGFESGQLDDYAYRFSDPFFVRIYQPDASATDTRCQAQTPPAESDYSFTLSDIRLGINGKLATVGQAFRNIGLDAQGEHQGLTITKALNANSNQQLMSGGTIIPLENGAQQDLFFLAFGHINNKIGVTSDPAPIVINPRVSTTATAQQGLRTFDKINHTMSQITGIPVTDARIAPIYNDVRTQLPTQPNPETFVAGHQVAVAQLAIAYCDVLVDNEAANQSANRQFFNSVDLTQTPDQMFANAASRDQIYDPLIRLTVGQNLVDQPEINATKSTFEKLLDGYQGNGIQRSGLLSCGASCPAGFSLKVIKSLCATSLGSSTLLVH